MKRSVLLVTLLAFTVPCLALGQATPQKAKPLQQVRSEASDPTADRILCMRVWTDYMEALKASDLVKIGDFFAKDAVLIYPDMPELRGREAIRSHFVKFKGLKVLDATFILHHCGVAGDQLYTFITIDEAYVAGQQPQVKTQGRVGAVWSRQPDNTWQISHFLLNHFTP